MRAYEYPEHLTEIPSLTIRAAQAEKQVWGNHYIIADLSFEKPTGKKEAKRILKKFLCQFCQRHHFHFSKVEYGGFQPHRLGGKSSWHFHLYMRALEQKSYGELRKIISELELRWWVLQGINFSEIEMSEKGWHHRSIRIEHMRDRLARYQRHPRSAGNSPTSDDATGFTTGHSGTKQTPQSTR